MKNNMKMLGLLSEWAMFGDIWRDFIWGKCLTIAYCGSDECFKKKTMMMIRCIKDSLTQSK